MSTATERRLDVLDALRGELGPDGGTDSYLLGALVAYVSDADWQAAIAITRSCAAEMAKLREQRSGIPS